MCVYVYTADTGNLMIHPMMSVLSFTCYLFICPFLSTYVHFSSPHLSTLPRMCLILCTGVLISP